MLQIQPQNVVTSAIMLQFNIKMWLKFLKQKFRGDNSTQKPKLRLIAARLL